MTWVVALAGLGVAVATALARVQYGVETWRSPRYAYVVAVLLLPIDAPTAAEAPDANLGDTLAAVVDESLEIVAPHAAPHPGRDGEVDHVPRAGPGAVTVLAGGGAALTLSAVSASPAACQASSAGSRPAGATSGCATGSE